MAKGPVPALSKASVKEKAKSVNQQGKKVQTDGWEQLRA